MDISDFISLLRNADKKKKIPVEVKKESYEASPIVPIVTKPVVDKKEDAPTAPDFGCWWKSDSHGSLLGDDRGEPPFRNVSRIYGTKRRY